MAKALPSNFLYVYYVNCILKSNEISIHLWKTQPLVYFLAENEDQKNIENITFSNRENFYFL